MNFLNIDIVMCKMEKQDFCFQNSAFKCLMTFKNPTWDSWIKRWDNGACFPSVTIIILSHRGQSCLCSWAKESMFLLNANNIFLCKSITLVVNRSRPDHNYAMYLKHRSEKKCVKCQPHSSWKWAAISWVLYQDLWISCVSTSFNCIGKR